MSHPSEFLGKVGSGPPPKTACPECGKDVVFKTRPADESADGYEQVIAASCICGWSETYPGNCVCGRATVKTAFIDLQEAWLFWGCPNDPTHWPETEAELEKFGIPWPFEDDRPMPQNWLEENGFYRV